MNTDNISKQSDQKMSFRKRSIFSRVFSCFSRKKKKDPFGDLNRKLVYSLSPKKIPSIKQVKYLKRVLGPREKKILNFSLVAILLVIIFFAFRFYQKHLIISPAFGGKYTEGLLGTPKNINPLYDVARDVDSDISRLIYSALFKRDAVGNLVNDLVESYNVSENGLEYDIKIREGVKWHHGEDLSSNDIVFTFEAIKNPDYGSPLRNTFSGVSISKIDEYSVKFTLSESYSSFLELLTFGILPESLWINISPSNAYLHELNIKPIGSGPYKFRSLTKNKSGEIKEFLLVANSDYFLQTPYIDRLVLKFFNNYNELSSALNNNQIDGISYLPHALKSDLVSQSSLNFNKINLPQITSIFFSKKNNSILNDKNIRQILSRLIDKNKICDEIFSGNARRADGPILPSSASYQEMEEKYNYDYDLASKLLDEASWELFNFEESELLSIRELIDLEGQAPSTEALEEEGADFSDYFNRLEEQKGIVASIDKWEVKKYIVKNLSLIEDDIIGAWRFKKSSDKNKVYDFLMVNLTTVDLADNIMVAEFIKDSWDRAGVKTFLKVISPSQVQTDIIKQKNFEALLLGQVVGGDQDNYAFWHSSQIGDNGLNISEYKNKEVDKLLEEARLSLNSEEKINNYKKFQETLNKDFPIIFLYFPTYTYVQNKKIKGFDFENILNPADRFNNISQWYIKVNRKIKF